MKRVAIVGVSGFAGVELVRIIKAWPEVSLSAAYSDRWSDLELGPVARIAGPTARVRVQPASKIEPDAADLFFLATPADVSLALAPKLVQGGARVVDLSGAFRLAEEAYPSFYGFEHTAPELLEQTCYGLTELPACWGASPLAADTKLVANPGCYATAAILALAPLVAKRLIDPTSIMIDGKSGVTGAGRKVLERLSFTSVDENVSPYRIGNHQHAPEIERALRRLSDERAAVTFVPHLMPLRRGLMATAYARLEEDVGEEKVIAAFAELYADAPLIELVPAARIGLSRVVRTPLGVVGAAVVPSRRTVVAFGAIDNLLKGAASQAVQNAARLLGLSQTPFDEWNSGAREAGTGDQEVVPW